MAKNAFLILAHSDPTHLERLVRALIADYDVFIHIDAKADITDYTRVISIPNVYLTKKRYRVVWAGISMVDGILELMRTAIQSKNQYGHLGILTGADYPIKSNEYINRILEDNPEKEFLKYSSIHDSRFYTNLINKKSFRSPIFESDNKIIDKVDRYLRKLFSLIGLPNRWRDDVKPFRGHTWCILTAACCRYIVDFVENNPWYHEMNVHTFAPDEHYFHTIIGNSSFASNSEGLWPCRGDLSAMATSHLIDASLTHWFTLADWGRIKASERLFVRKVRSIDGGLLMDKIDREIRGSADGGIS